MCNISTYNAYLFLFLGVLLSRPMKLTAWKLDVEECNLEDNELELPSHCATHVAIETAICDDNLANTIATRHGFRNLGKVRAVQRIAQSF